MDVEKIADSLFKALESRIERQIAPLLSRLAVLEERQVPTTSQVASEILGSDELSTLVDLHVAEAVAQIEPIKGEKGDPGEHGHDGEDGVDGKDGIGLAGALIDRDGNLIVTMTNGEAKSLGPVVGRDGKDGIGITELVRSYDPKAHEIVEKWADKEIRYPAGGIYHGGYWREGTKAAAGQTWNHAGNCWIAKIDTKAKPSRESDDWEIFASKGRDGLDYKHAPPREPVKLHGN